MNSFNVGAVVINKSDFMAQRFIFSTVIKDDGRYTTCKIQSNDTCVETWMSRDHLKIVDIDVLLDPTSIVSNIKSYILSNEEL